MMKVRVMLPEGEQKFRDYIHNLKVNPLYTRPDLNVDYFSQEFSPEVLIDETKHFNSRMDLAEYLQNCFNSTGVKREHILPINGMWTWLAYIWFDQLAPIKNSDTKERKLGEDARYICSSNYSDYYRHLIAGPYRIYSLHNPENLQIFLYDPVHNLSDYNEQFSSRQFLISHRNIVEAFQKLYFDPQARQPKQGSQSRKKPGYIRRFVKILQQFELTYDIYTMPADRILDLLPPEFDGWK